MTNLAKESLQEGAFTTPHASTNTNQGFLLKRQMNKKIDKKETQNKPPSRQLNFV